MTDRFAITLIAAGAVGLVLSSGRIAPTHYIWNASSSVPVGLYRLQPISGISVPDLVAIRPPEPLATYLSDGGYLPRNVLLLKHVLALAGQTVCRNDLSVAVDGVTLGEARERDSRGRLLPSWQGCRVISASDIFVMNWQSPDSLDGRYFGVIRRSSVVGRAIPIWTWEP